jgi:hypothetical protein
VKEEVKDEMLTLYSQQTSFGESLNFIAEVVYSVKISDLRPLTIEHRNDMARIRRSCPATLLVTVLRR